MTEETAPRIEAPVCYRHPDRETWVSCVRCSRPICPDCMNAASVGFQCPECVREGNRGVRTGKTVFGGSLAGERGTVTLTLIGINIGVWVLGLALAVLGGVPASRLMQLVVTGAPTGLYEWGAAIPGPVSCSDGSPCGIATGEYYRLITSDFLHFGILHLALNMYALWLLGRECERLVGRWRFLALYLLSGVGGATAVYLFGAQTTLSAGASASIFGLLGALFFFFRRMRADLRGLVGLIVINVAITFFIPGISIFGHLGGLFTGAAVGAVLAYAPNRPFRTAMQVAGLCAVGLALVLAVIARTAMLAVP